MFLFQSYVGLLLLVSIFPLAVPQIRNLSPLRGRINTEIPDALRTTTVANFASAGAGPALRGRFNPPSPTSGFGGGINPFFAIPNAPGALGTGGGFGGGGVGGVAFSSADTSFGGGIGGTTRVIVIDADDVEDALEAAFGQSSRIRPQGGFGGSAAQRPPPPSSSSSSSSSGFPVDSAEEDSLEDFTPPSVASFGLFLPRLEGTSLAHFGFRLTQLTSELDSNCIGQPVEGASIILSNGLTPGEALERLPNLELDEDSCRRKQRRSNCPNTISPFSGTLCNPNTPYRSHDGSCNNLRNPEWGAAKRPFNRYLQPAYEDGIHDMRGEGRDVPLPSARTVSAGLQGNGPQAAPREDLTLLVMQWGQFLDHDLTHTPEATSDDNDDTPSPMGCCEFGDPNFPSDDNCRPIDVANDPLYRQQGRRCMRFVRSLVASKGCSTGSLGPREQLNQLTSYLDASNVYGSDDEEATGLRTRFGGLLRDSQPPSVRHGNFLPRARCIEAMNNEQNCFEAGDVRVNEQPALTSMHTLWLRVHNNIATELASINPSWDDEMIYQETRRIVSALHQQITYREFLPIVLGPDFMREFQLNLRDQGYDNSYDSRVDATIVNVFATAAFRFGHTLIAEIFKGMGRNVTLRGNFDEPHVLEDPSTGPAAILQGLTTCPTRGSDAFLTPTLVNHLLSKSTDPVGLDLMALNIQRGRDHGLPPYHEWRRSCGLSPINSFEDLFSIMDPEAAFVFAESYQSVEDIDLFPAALAENTMVGGILGPTFSCLLAQQFQALKLGDRFWYENMNQPNPFTTGQLSSIRQQSLSSIMCQHLELNSLQPMAFRSDRLQGNQLQDCSSFPRLDLRSWSLDPLNPPITPTPPNPIPNPTPRPNDRYAKRPRFPCITPGTPKSHLLWFFPMCTPDLFIMNY